MGKYLEQQIHTIYEDNDTLCCYIDVTSLQDMSVYQNYIQLVSTYRAEKSNRMRFPSGKAQSLGVGLLLDYCLSRKYQLREKDMIYSAPSMKKPVFSNHPEIHFNASHSEKYVAVIVSNKEVGIDIQQIGKAEEKIAKRFFTTNEYNYIVSQSDDEQKKDAFYRIWTLKESFIKYTGEGMSRELNSFEFDLTKNPVTISILDGIVPKVIPTFQEFIPITGYRMTICY